MSRRRITALAAGILVVAFAAATVQAAFDALWGPPRAQAIDAKLDHPHRMRPVAAVEQTQLEAEAPLREKAAALEWKRAHEILLVTVLVNQAREREEAARRARSAPRASVAGSGAPGGTLACIRNRESRGNYAAVNGSSGASGAYQFLPGTWNSTAASAGRSDLVGVNPAAASQADQDAMAQRLLATRGLAPWGGACG